MQKEVSLIDLAVSLLEIEKKPFDLYQLFDVVTAERKIPEEKKADIVTKFYTDLTTSAKFVYVGDNKWDLKANQKIELWEKDGSFYKEYTVVELPEEFKETPKVVAKPAKKEVKPEPVVEEVVVVEEPVVVEEVVAKPVVKEKDLFADVTEAVEPEVVESYEEEIFEDYDDFDEEKYNEYMDTYEDQYDD